MSSATLTPRPVEPPSQLAAAEQPTHETREFLPEWRPNIDHLIFEDGISAESPYAERQMRLWIDPLYISWQGVEGDRQFAAMSNVGLFHEPKQTQVVPDGMLSTGVVLLTDQGGREHLSYLMWEYGKSPDVALELVSDKRGGELDWKKERYARIHVPYYVVFDPRHVLSEQSVHVFRLLGLGYEPMPEAWFPDLGLGLKIWDEPYQGAYGPWLRWHTSEGQWLPTGEEQKARADQAEQRADQAEQRAEEEQHAREKLMAQLRALGVEPNLEG